MIGEKSTGKKKLLILGKDQFGYVTITLKHCEYSREEFDVTYMGWDYGLPSIEMEGVTVKHVSRRSNGFRRVLRLLMSFVREIRRGKYEVVFANYVRGISVVQMLSPKMNFIVYIRTLGVSRKKIRRLMYDIPLKVELLFLNNVSILSYGMAKKIGLKDYRVLPLGGERFSDCEKSFDCLSLLYVGTLENREIMECVRGLNMLISSGEENTDQISFTIIGDGPDNELDQIKAYVVNNDLSDYVTTTGYLPQDRLGFYFDEANIGVSYVPLKPYYEFQPPSKTFEYLISGLPVIATSTYENKKLLKPNAGVIIGEGAQEFHKGMKKLLSLKHTFDSSDIANDYADYRWEKVVKEYFVKQIHETIADGK